MPFAEGAQEVYDAVIKPTAAAAGFSCRRADESIQPININSDIVASIYCSDIVIADISWNNPNVFYELSIAHSFCKPTVIITQNADFVPFDLSAYRVFAYDMTMAGGRRLSSSLLGQFNLCAQGMLKVSNPVSDHMERSALGSVVRMGEAVRCEAGAASEVCVLAPDIEVGPRVFQDTMVANLHRGVSYRYLVANTDVAIRKLGDFIERMSLGESADRFKARLIDPDFIESDVTLIDPNTTLERGFILAPAEKADFNYRIVGGALFRAKERFEKLWVRAGIYLVTHPQ